MNKFIDNNFIRQALRITILLFVSTVLVLWAWNNAMTAIFGLPVIHFKEASGIVILAIGVSILFKPGGYPVKSVTRNSHEC